MFSVPRSQRIQHARRDSNPQPTVLETATLPIELLAYKIFLLHLFLIFLFLEECSREQTKRKRQRKIINPEFRPRDRRQRFCRLRECQSESSFPSRSG